ncbi:MAG: hypothetical protein NTZ05_16230 [Chloroflexi bacterium]|nr:hypothetical protein [Chloroflexota bacterium]
MIVRIQGEGQYRVPSAVLDQLNEIDNRMVTLVATGAAAEFTTALGQLLSLVRAHGQAVELEELVESDVMLPSDDTTMDEAHHLFTGEGAIPG